MSHCIVPDWNSRKQRQRQEEIEEDQDHVSCVHERADGTNYIGLIGSTNYEVGELAWDNYNRQPAVPLHGHGGIQLPPQTKPTWGSTRTGDTLESLVHQATFSNTTQLRYRGDLDPTTYSASSIPTSSAGKWVVGSSKSESSSGVKWRENSTHVDMGQNLAANLSSMTTSSCGKWRENSSHMQVEQNDHGVKIGSMPTYSRMKISSMEDYSGRKRAENSSSGLVSKRIRSESVKFLGKNCSQVEERGSSGGVGGGVGASATFCEENTDTNMMTWASLESAPSMKIPRNVGNDSACQDFSDEEFKNKEEIARSQSSTRRGRDAVVHNELERRRRDKINEKLKALQKLVPNANKTDKASMLDEVIKYLKQLQAQVQMLSNARAMPHQMVMPLGMQQQLQMSLLGRMGIGPVGMGIVDVNNLARSMPQPFTPLHHGSTPLSTTGPSFVSPPFPVPSLVPPLAQLKASVYAADINRYMPDFNDSYGTFLAQQSMNMDFYNRMVSLYKQQTWRPSKKPDSLPRQNNVQGD